MTGVQTCALPIFIYIGKIIEALYFKPVTDSNQSVQEAPLLLLAPLWILVCANIYFGLDTDLTVGVAEKAADVLGVINK